MQQFVFYSLWFFIIRFFWNSSRSFSGVLIGYFARWSCKFFFSEAFLGCSNSYSSNFSRYECLILPGGNLGILPEVYLVQKFLIWYFQEFLYNVFLFLFSPWCQFSEIMPGILSRISMTSAKFCARIGRSIFRKIWEVITVVSGKNLL